MTQRKPVVLAGLAGVACAACCSGPVIALVAAWGLGTVLAAVLGGLAAAAVVFALGGVLVARWRRRRASGSTQPTGPVPVELSVGRDRR